jgi:hypothetical protein
MPTESEVTVKSQIRSTIEESANLPAGIPGTVCAASTICLPLALTLLLCAGCQSPSFTHSEFDSRVKALNRLVILPVPATGRHAEFLSSTPEPFPQADQFSAVVKEATTREFERRHFKVLTSKLPAGDCGAISNHFENRQLWMQLQLRRADQTLARVGGFIKGHCVRPEAPLLAEYEGVDGLIFVYAARVTESSSARTARYTINTASVIIGTGLALSGAGSSTPVVMGSPAGCCLEVILVEGRTGDVLWRSRVVSTDPDGLTPRQAVEAVFARYPGP